MRPSHIVASKRQAGGGARSSSDRQAQRGAFLRDGDRLFCLQSYFDVLFAHTLKTQLCAQCENELGFASELSPALRGVKKL